jgi:hypothetical protein
MRLLGYVSALAVLGLSCRVLYLQGENSRMHEAFANVYASTDASFSACVLPQLRGRTASGGALALEFPRQKPLLLLVSNKACPNCTGALEKWGRLVKRLPVDGLVFDLGRSYSDSELESAGVASENVGVAVDAADPYRTLFAATPSVILVGRTGAVLGVWRGELSARRVAAIESSVAALI